MKILYCVRNDTKYFDRYFGILNGIDTAIWNPATDAFLPAKFDGNNSFVQTIDAYSVSSPFLFEHMYHHINHLKISSLNQWNVSH